MMGVRAKDCSLYTQLQHMCFQNECLLVALYKVALGWTLGYVFNIL